MKNQPPLPFFCRKGICSVVATTLLLFSLVAFTTLGRLFALPVQSSETFYRDSLVTVKDYTKFLNAVAQDDPDLLYQELYKTLTPEFVILREGEPGSYSYLVEGEDSLPMQGVPLINQLRFCNWMEQGAPDSMKSEEELEVGSYNIAAILAGEEVAPEKTASYQLIGEHAREDLFAVSSEKNFGLVALAEPERGGAFSPDQNFLMMQVGVPYSSHDNKGNAGTIAATIGGVIMGAAALSKFYSSYREARVNEAESRNWSYTDSAQEVLTLPTLESSMLQDRTLTPKQTTALAVVTFSSSSSLERASISWQRRPFDVRETPFNELTEKGYQKGSWWHNMSTDYSKTLSYFFRYNSKEGSASVPTVKERSMSSLSKSFQTTALSEPRNRKELEDLYQKKEKGGSAPNFELSKTSISEFTPITLIKLLQYFDYYRDLRWLRRDQNNYKKQSLQILKKIFQSREVLLRNKELLCDARVSNSSLSLAQQQWLGAAYYAMSCLETTHFYDQHSGSMNQEVKKDWYQRCEVHLWHVREYLLIASLLQEEEDLAGTNIEFSKKVTSILSQLTNKRTNLIRIHSSEGTLLEETTGSYLDALHEFEFSEMNHNPYHSTDNGSDSRFFERDIYPLYCQKYSQAYAHRALLLKERLLRERLRVISQNEEGGMDHNVEETEDSHELEKNFLYQKLSHLARGYHQLGLELQDKNITDKRVASFKKEIKKNQDRLTEIEYDTHKNSTKNLQEIAALTRKISQARTLLSSYEELSTSFEQLLQKRYDFLNYWEDEVEEFGLVDSRLSVSSAHSQAEPKEEKRNALLRATAAKRIAIAQVLQRSETFKNQAWKSMTPEEIALSFYKGEIEDPFCDLMGTTQLALLRSRSNSTNSSLKRHILDPDPEINSGLSTPFSGLKSRTVSEDQGRVDTSDVLVDCPTLFQDEEKK